MAKSQVAQAPENSLTIEKAQDYLYKIMIGRDDDVPVTRQEIFAFLESTDLKYFQEFTGEYLKLEENKTYHFTCEGIETKTIKGKEIPCAILVDANNNRGISGAAVLIQALKSVDSLPAFVRIVAKKWETAKDGDYLDMKVFVLPTVVAQPQ